MRDRRVEIAPMREEDIDAIVEIESHAFRNPWPRQVFSEEIGREWAYVDVVRERDPAGASQVVAFCNYWLVRDEIHLLNIAVHPDRRRGGHGRRLMDHMLAFARHHDCRYVTLEVRRSNEPAIAMYRGYGFEEVGLRPRYYAEDGEDALVMTLELEPSL
jgi:[ribosomal protein S18]-alanine N-acetyltransferase